MKQYVVIMLVVLGCVILFGFNLGDLSLLKGDENYYFSSGRRMIKDADWITPRYHHHVRFEKPPLYYWLVALFFKLFGVSWTSARMTSVLFGTLTVLLTYLFALRFFDKKRALLASAILATSFLFFKHSRIAVIDMTFLFLVTLSLFLALKGERENKKGLLLLSFAPLGLSILAKGPLGVVIYILTILVYALRTRRFRILKWPDAFLGIIIMLLISLPWFILMYKIHGQVYLNHIWEIEAVDKTIGSILKLKGINNIILFGIKYISYYLPVVIFAFVPWSLFLPFGLFKKIDTNKKEGAAFILSWFWVVFLFFTIASFKHTHYMLLLSPPLAMIAANFFSNRKIAAAIAAIMVIIYLSLTGFILPALDDGTLKVFSLKLATEVKKDEEIGISSPGFNLKKLGIHLNNLVATPYEVSPDDLVGYKDRKKKRIAPFLMSPKRVYSLITKRDFIKYVPTELRRELYILEKSMMWKKFDFKETLSIILRMDWNNLKEEVYLISNGKD